MMKTKCIFLFSACLICVACDRQTGGRSPSSSDPGGEGHLLITEFPPELIEGTPVPIRLRGLPSGQVSPATAPGPGTDGVFYAPQTGRPAKVPSRPTAPQVRVTPPEVSREQYAALGDSRWQAVAEAPLSTFSVDVDSASYANIRRLILDGSPVPRDAVRLEEMVNYFDYAYPPPTGDHPFAVDVRNADCPWNPEHQLVRVALKGKEIERMERPAANLVFLIDVSGSMRSDRKLPLVVDSLRILVEEMNASDSLAIVVYAGSEGLLLPATSCDAEGKTRIDTALRDLSAGGSTNGGAGIRLAYGMAREHFIPGGINRVILATDGDFNVGVTGIDELVGLVAENAKSHVDMTVMGVGTGNLNDSMLESITNHGNGTYYYIDSLREARRVFLDKMMGTLVTIARDVKIQVEFNPEQVKSYRLLGYVNRRLRDRDFADDRVDAGDIGSGHTVTALYEVSSSGFGAQAGLEALRYAVPATGPEDDADPEWLTVKLRYKRPGESESIRLVQPYIGVRRELGEAGADFRFATAVAMAALRLRGEEGMDSFDFKRIARIARESLGGDPHGQRAEFVRILDRLASRDGLRRE